MEVKSGVCGGVSEMEGGLVLGARWEHYSKSSMEVLDSLATSMQHSGSIPFLYFCSLLLLTDVSRIHHMII